MTTIYVSGRGEVSPEMEFLMWANCYDANLVRLVGGDDAWQKFEEFDRDILKFLLILDSSDLELILADYQKTALAAIAKNPDELDYYPNANTLSWKIILPIAKELVKLVTLIQNDQDQATQVMDKIVGPAHPGFPHNWYVHKWHQEYGNPKQSMILYNMMDPNAQRLLRRYLVRQSKII